MVVQGRQGLTLKVLDFGIAKAMQEGETATRVQTRTSSGFSAFSPSYGAPEQFYGKKYGATGPWTDVHALGLILTELVSGRPPLEGDDLAELQDAATSEVRPTPRERGALVSDGFEAVVAQAVARSPKERFGNAKALLLALEQASTASARPVPTVAMVAGTEIADLFPNFEAKGIYVATPAPTPVRTGPSGTEWAPPAPVAAALSTSAAQAQAFTPFGPAPSGQLPMPPSSAKSKRNRQRLLVVVAIVLLGALGIVVGLSAKTGAPFQAASAYLKDNPLSMEDAHRAATRVRLTERDRMTGPMVTLPGGTFQMGSDKGASDEKPVHPVTVNPFCMDRTEVTVSAYTECVKAGKCTDPGSGGNFGKSDRGNHPINQVDWNQSTAFCAWAEKRLPTEEEWEYAARGTDGREYPWGNTAPGNQLCWDGEGNDLGKGNRHGTCPVGSYPTGRSPFGLDDMAGNVWEWTSSAYSENYGKDRTSPLRVLRGGGWRYDGVSGVRGASRLLTMASNRYNDVGFRCARTRSK